MWDWVHLSQCLFQVAADDISNARIAKPFWEIVADPKWAVVDQEMKEACDRLDRGQSDAVTYATRGLESAIKIISDEHGWSTGSERGAVNYIENLQSERSGRFIATWEADALKAIFRHLRNPYSQWWRRQSAGAAVQRSADLGRRQLHDLDQESRAPSDNLWHLTSQPRTSPRWKRNTPLSETR
jgi:hypothetical protein